MMFRTRARTHRAIYDAAKTHRSDVDQSLAPLLCAYPAHVLRLPLPPLLGADRLRTLSRPFYPRCPCSCESAGLSFNTIGSVPYTCALVINEYQNTGYIFTIVNLITSII